MTCVVQTGNFHTELESRDIPSPQMLSLRIITDNVVLIRRVEILASVQKACHLRIHQHRGCKQPPHVQNFRPPACQQLEGEGSRDYWDKLGDWNFSYSLYSGEERRGQV